MVIKVLMAIKAIKVLMDIKVTPKNHKKPKKKYF